MPDGICRLLAVLNGGGYRDVTWTLGHSFKGFYLNLQWPKHVKFPAKNRGRGQSSTNTESGLITPTSVLPDTPVLQKEEIPTASQDNSGTQSGKPAKGLGKPRPRQKRRSHKKSPSTKRHNRRRWLNWLSRKKSRYPTGNQENCPVPKRQEPTHPEAHCSGTSKDSREPKVTPDSATDRTDLASSQVDSTLIQTASPDTESDQADSIFSQADSTPLQDAISIETGQSTDPRSSHPSDSEYTPDDPNESESSESAESFFTWLTRQPKCFNCSTPQTTPNGLKKCTRCLSALYCDRNCQAEHWKEHRPMCKLVS